jgi:hypothetical protein
MVTIAVSSDEISAGSLTAANRAAAVSAVSRDGFVVLEGVVSRESIDALRERMLADVEAFRTRKDAPINWNAGNLQQGPPPFPPFLFRDVLVNDLVIDVTRAILGNGVKSFYYSGNTAVRSEKRQPVHADTGQLWPNQEVAHPPAQLVINVPVVDMSAENGSTEIWPGTHRDLSVVSGHDIKVSPEALEARRAVSPPIQPNVRAGSVLIRDIRLWHAGMPNRTDTPRPMIAMIHCPHWMGTPSLRFPNGTQEFFRHPHLNTVAEFVDGEIDYVAEPQAYEPAPGER